MSTERAFLTHNETEQALNLRSELCHTEKVLKYQAVYKDLRGRWDQAEKDLADCHLEAERLDADLKRDGISFDEVDPLN